jgi:hypothetical protein
MTGRTTRLVVALTVLLGVVLASAAIAPPAIARAPGNDKFGKAAQIGDLFAQPYHKEENSDRAKSQSSDPGLTNCENREAAGQTVWFKLTPDAAFNVTADTIGSDFDTVLALFEQQGSGTGGLVPRVCDDDIVVPTNQQSQVSFSVNANTTYYFMVGTCCTRTAGGSGHLVFNVKVS